MCTKVQLTRGKTALIDDDDLEIVSGHIWHAAQTPQGLWYARTNMVVNGKRRCIGLHQLVMGIPDPLTVDHKDLNTLDCRKHNLRIATRSQQNANRRAFRTNRSGYKGVIWHGNRYRVSIQSRFVPGMAFHSAEEAARAYDRLAVERFGEFARLNFP